MGAVSAEASILCNAVAWCDAEATSEALLAPLLRALCADLAPLAAGSKERLSKVGSRCDVGTLGGVGQLGACFNI